MSLAARTHLQQALNALQRGQAALARDAAQHALALDPNNADGWRLRGFACEALGDREAMLASFARVLALHPDSMHAAYEFGHAQLKLGQAAQALPHLQRAAAGQPQRADVAHTLGLAYFALARYRDAHTALTQTVTITPEHAEGWNALAATELKLGEVPAAVQAARRALALRPDAARLQHTLAAALSWTFEHASLEEGRQWVQRALAALPEDAEAHHTAAVLLRKLGDLNAAAAHAREALRLVPDHPEYALALGEILQLAGDSAGARHVYDTALGAHPQHPALHRQRGIARLQAAQPEAARADLQTALAQAPDDQRAIAHLAVALAAAGDIAGASDLVGLHRHVYAVRLAVPGAFTTADAFHRQLAQDIRQHSQQRWEPAGLAARGGYLSGDLLADKTPAILGFERSLRAAIDTFIAGLTPDPADPFLRAIPAPPYRMHLWATRVSEAGNIDTHIHEESWLSGAYYVDLPPALENDDDPHAGWIEFGRPYHDLPGWPEDALRRIRPEVGTLLLFPSFLFHRTLPYRGTGERISISFDLASAL